MYPPVRLTSGLWAVALSLSAASSVSASGFAVQTHSVPNLSNGGAGGASAENASTVFDNPAGMTLLTKPQLYAGAHYAVPQSRFRNAGATTLGAPTQGEDSRTDEEAVLPDLFYVGRAGDELAFGIGVTAPFGLATRYEDGWVGRYLALETSLKTLVVNPSLAYRINDQLSVGAGVSYLRAEATLSNAVNFGAVFLGELQGGGIPANEQTLALAQDIQANLGSAKYDGELELKGDGDGWGGNVGLLYEVNEDLRIGAHYRSGISVDLSGDADFSVGLLDAALGPAFPDQEARTHIDLPASYSVSVYGNASERLALMADVTRTQWSDFHDLAIEYENGDLPDTVIPELWRDVSKYSVGASYRFSDRFTGRSGIAYDQSLAPSAAYRSPRIPDGDRIWLSFGLSVRLSESTECHFGYLHIFVDDSSVDNPTHAAGERLMGRLESSVDLVSFGSAIRF